MRAALVALVLTAASMMAGCSSPTPTPPAGHPTETASPPASAAQPPTAPTTPTPPTASDPFEVSPTWAAFQRVPKLPKKIANDPYSYYRFINAQFSAAVCAELGDFAAPAASVPLHGDAHVEQYALTDIGRGLTDFDDMATGPAVVDLARMTTSLVIVSRMRKFSEDAALGAFLGGYREGLAGKAAPKPAITAELQKKFKDDPKTFLEGADKMMQPIDEDATLSEAQMKSALAELEKAMRAQRKGLAPGFFKQKKLGPFHAGIGSALDRKFLVRVEGATSKPDDDRVVEMKFVGERKLAPCVKRRLEHAAGDFRADVPKGSTERYLPPTFVGPSEAWAQEWYPNFHEIDADSISEADLGEVAREAGALLAREHMRGAPAASLTVDAAHEARLQTVSKALATRVEMAWKKFKDGLPLPKDAPKP